MILAVSVPSGSCSAVLISKQNQDVLCGRGGLSNNHLGNHVFRRIVNANKGLYQTCNNPVHKHCIVVSIIVSIQRKGGRFIEKRRGGGWQEIAYRKAMMKTSQALREALHDFCRKSIKPALTISNKNSKVQVHQLKIQQKPAFSSASTVRRAWIFTVGFLSAIM